MDATELHYVTYDPEAIWEDMMVAYVEAGGDILYPGDEKEILLRGVLADIVQVFAGVDNGLRMQTLRYAVGEYLDVLGEQRNCERIQATAATATVTIATNATGQSGTIPAGTAMTADGEVFYSLLEDLTLSGNAQSMTVSIVADRTGSVGNGLSTGTQMQMQGTYPAIRSIIVATDAAGGQDAEDDDAYRERIRQHGLISVTTGPREQYEAAAMAVSTQIIDAHAMGYRQAGSVAVYLIIDEDADSAAILQQVRDALNSDDARPLTDAVTVMSSSGKAYALNVTVTYPSSLNIAAAISQAVEDYQAWQDEKIGRAFNPDMLAASLYQLGATRVQFAAGDGIDGGGAVYTEIAEYSHCVGTINLTTIVE